MNLVKTYDGLSCEPLPEDAADKLLLGAYGEGRHEIMEQLRTGELGSVRTMFAWIYTEEEWKKTQPERNRA